MYPEAVQAGVRPFAVIALDFQRDRNVLSPGRRNYSGDEHRGKSGWS